MKIAVITMHAVKNYGSVLQAYATQKVLDDLGNDTVIIDYVRKKNLDENLINTWTQNDHGIKKLIKSVVLLPTINRWKKVFNLYVYDNLHLTNHRYTCENDFNLYPINTDVFCTGSDQVWNSGWNNGIEKPFYLSFVSEEIPKISIAASIGKEQLDQQEITEIKPLLERYSGISVRELTAKGLLRRMGLSYVQFCLDPTLLLSSEQWREHAIDRNIKKRYILVYQLDHDKQFDKYAVEVSKKKNLELIRICTRYDQIRLPGKPIVLPEVREFINLIDNAECVITNSFHATAFCINLNSNFISIYPDSYSSRIKDILSLFNLQERHLTSWDDVDLIDRKINFELVNAILEDERNSSISIIRELLSESSKKIKNYANKRDN